MTSCSGLRRRPAAQMTLHVCFTLIGMTLEFRRIGNNRIRTLTQKRHYGELLTGFSFIDITVFKANEQFKDCCFKFYSSTIVDQMFTNDHN